MKKRLKKPIPPPKISFAVERSALLEERLALREQEREKNLTELLLKLSIAIEEASTENDLKFLLHALVQINAPSALMEKARSRLYFVVSSNLKGVSVFPSLLEPVPSAAENNALPEPPELKLPEQLFLSLLKSGYWLSLESREKAVPLSKEQIATFLCPTMGQRTRR